MAKTDSKSKLDEDVLSLVFAYLKPKHWWSVLCTCKSWNTVGKKIFDPSIRNDRAIVWACQKKFFHLLEELIQDKRVNVSVCNNYVLRYLCKEGQTELVKKLLKIRKVDASADEDSPIVLASSYGHADVVEELLQDDRVDPSCFDNIPIRWACQLGHINVVKALLKDNRVELDNELIQYVVTTLKKRGKLTDEVEVLISVRTWNMY